MSRFLGRSVLAAAALASAGALTGCSEPAYPAAVLVEGEFGITGLAVDDFNVYFSKKDGTVKKVSRDGGPVTELASGIVDPKQIALDDTDVYWASSTGTVGRVPKMGGELSVLAEEPNLAELALDSTFVYFTVDNPDAEKTGAVRRVAKSDGVLSEVASNQTRPGPLAYDHGFLYWASSAADGDLQRIGVNGGDTFALLHQVRPISVSVDPSFVYWGSFGTGTVSRAALDGSDVREIAIGQEELFKVVGDGINVYWTKLDGSITMAPVEGGAEPFELSSGPAGPVFIALDLTSVYSARFETGTILVRPKPEDYFE